MHNVVTCYILLSIVSFAVAYGTHHHQLTHVYQLPCSRGLLCAKRNRCYAFYYSPWQPATTTMFPSRACVWSQITTISPSQGKTDQPLIPVKAGSIFLITTQGYYNILSPVFGCLQHPLVHTTLNVQLFLLYQVECYHLHFPDLWNNKRRAHNFLLYNIQQELFDDTDVRE